MTHQPTDTISIRGLKSSITNDTAVSAPLPCTKTPPPAEIAYLVQIAPAGPGLGRKHTVGPAPAVVGREPSCSLCVADGGVSRAHARIEPGPDGQFRLLDLGSRNGTFVNGTRVQTAALKDGDYLQVGGAVFRFLAGGNLETAYHEEIHRLTVLDPLTGVHNRRSLAEFLDREVERALRHARPLSVLLVDLDHFKRVNDRFGHQAGDAVLQAVAARLRRMTRGDDLLARYGGEEFAVVLAETDLPGAVVCAERIRKAVTDMPVEIGRQVLRVTVSIGVGSLTHRDTVQSAAAILQTADARLYEAKHAGRNRVCPAVPGDPPTSRTPTTPPEPTREVRL